MALGIIGGMLASAAISSAFGSASNAINAKTDYHYDKKLWDYQTTHQYQNTMKDLKEAGLNPMLAYQGLGSTVGGNVQGSPSPVDVNGVNSAKAQKAQIDIAKLQADTERLKAEAEVKEKEENIKYLQALTNRTNLLAPAENGLMVAQTQFHQRNIIKSVAEIDKIRSDILNNNRITDAQITQLIEQAKHLRVITGNESINYDLLVRARDSKSESLKREYLSTWFGEQTAYWNFMINDLTGGTGLSLGVNSRGNYGVHQK